MQVSNWNCMYLKPQMRYLTVYLSWWIQSPIDGILQWAFHNISRPLSESQGYFQWFSESDSSPLCPNLTISFLFSVRWTDVKNRTHSFDNVMKINVFFYQFFLIIFFRSSSQMLNIKYIELTSTKAEIKKIMFNFLH